MYSIIKKCIIINYYLQRVIEEQKRAETLSLGLLTSKSFKLKKYLGQGVFGKTFLVKCILPQLKSFKKDYVIKIVDPTDKSHYEDQMNEMEVYNRLQVSPYYATLIAKFRDTIKNSDFEKYFSKDALSLSTIFVLFNYYPQVYFNLY